MTTEMVVPDEQLGVLARRYHDLFRRVREGSIPIGPVLQGMQDLQEGNFGAIPTGPRRLVDCDAQPYIPDGWRIERHTCRGLIEFDPARIELFQHEKQKKGGTITGDDLFDAVKDRIGLNACVLDHSLENTGNLPGSWKKDDQGRTRYIIFPDTVFRDSDDFLYVRFLFWDDGRWDWDDFRLDDDFDDQYWVALLAS